MQQDEHQLLAAAKDVRRITLVGMLANLLLASAKLFVGNIARSQAMIADGVHSLSDMTTDLALLIGLRYWSKPADENHPYGHRRIETLVTVFIGLVLTGVAFKVGYGAMADLGHESTGQPGWSAVWVGLASVFVKEVLYRVTAATGRRVKSSATIANAWHHRSDALSSIPATLAVAAAATNPNWVFVDRVGAVLVCVFILQAAWTIMKPALGQLTDESVSKDDIDHIETVALATEGVHEVHAVRSRYIGSGIQTDLHILVDPNLTVRQGHDIARLTRQRIVAECDSVVDVLIHVEPYGERPQNSV